MTSELEKELEALENQLVEAERQEDAPVVVEKEEPAVEEAAAEDQEAKVEAEPAKEEAKEEPKKEPEEEVDAKGHARLRIEAKKERDRADKLAEEIRALKETKAEEAPEEEKQDRFKEQMTEVFQEVQTNKASREFIAFENEVRAANPEYDAISQEYTSALRAAARLDNPKLSPAQLNDIVSMKVLQKAGHYAAKGYENPVEALLDEAKSLGFTGASVKQRDEGVEEKKPAKPDMAKVADNRKKSPGTAGTGGGDAKGNLTMKYAVENFTLKDFEKMSDAEVDAMMRAG